MPDTKPYDVLFLDESEKHPSPLPTPNDIEAPVHDSCLVRVQQHFMVKYGTDVKPLEAHNMLYVAQSTTVPVPKVYAIYQRAEEQGLITYIVMQYVPGTTLVEAWPSLDKARKTAIALTLRTYFDQLRQLQSPGYFGTIAGGPPLDPLFWYIEDEMKTSLASEDELIDWIIRAHADRNSERMPSKTRYYQRVLPTALRGNGSPVFTHNDFQRKNVMMQPDGSLVIIDWEFAAWYPTYWEYSTALRAIGRWDDDWHEYVGMILDEYPTQFLYVSILKREIMLH